MKGTEISVKYRYRLDQIPRSRAAASENLMRIINGNNKGIQDKSQNYKKTQQLCSFIK